MFSGNTSTLSFDSIAPAVFDGGASNSSFNNISHTGDFGVRLANNITANTFRHVSSSSFDAAGYSIHLAGNLSVEGGTVYMGTAVHTIEANVFINGGNLTADTSTIIVKGNWTKTGGTFYRGNSIVNFAGTNPQTLKPGATGSSNFWTLLHSGSSTLNLTAETLYVRSTLSHEAGIFNTNGVTIDVTGGFMMNGNVNLSSSLILLRTGDWKWTAGILNAGTSTISFDGTAVQNINADGGGFYNLRHTGSGNIYIAGSSPAFGGTITNDAGTLFIPAAVTTTISRGINLAGGTVTAQASSILKLTGGDFSRTNGTFVCGTGTVSLDSPGVQNVKGSGGRFYNLVHTGMGSVLLTSDITADSFTKSNSGTFDSNNNNIKIAGTINLLGGNFIGSNNKIISTGAWSNPSGLFTSRNSTVEMLTGGSFIPGNGSFYDLISNTSGISQLNSSDLAVSRDLIINQATFDTNGRAINISRDLVLNNGTFLAGTSSNHIISRHITINNGSFMGDTSTVSLAGNWTRSGGTYSGDAWTMRLTSAGIQTIDAGSAANTFGSVRHTGLGTLNLAGNKITINTGFSQDAGCGIFNSAGIGMDVSGGFNMNGGNITAGSSHIKLIDGNLNWTAGVFNAGTSTLEFASGANQNLNTGVGVLNNLLHSGAGSLILNGAGNMTMSGDLQNNSGLLNGSAKTLVFSLASGLQTFAPGNHSAINSLSHTGAGTLSLTGTLTLTANVTNAAGVFKAGNNSIYLGGNWTNSASFEYGSSTVLFNGATQSVTPGASAFYNLTRNGTDNTNLTLLGDVTVESNLLISSGTLDAAGYNLHVRGNYTVDGTGWFTHNNGTIYFDGSSGQFVSYPSVQPASRFNDVIINNNSGGEIEILDDSVIDGDFIVEPGSIVDFDMHNVDIYGNWTNIGTVNSAPGNLYFKSNMQQIFRAGTDTYNNVIHSGAGILSFEGGVAIRYDLQSTSAGTIDAGGSNTIYLGGNFDMSSGTFISRTSILVLNGSSPQ